MIDDNHDSAESVALLARLWGHDTRVAHDGPAALQAAEEFGPDVVLLDIGLPGMSGYDVSQQLRLRLGSGRVVLVAMTGYGQEDDRRRTRAAGFQHHLVKPADTAELQRVLTSQPTFA